MAVENVTSSINISDHQELPFFKWRLMFYLISPSEIPDTQDIRLIPNYANEVIVVFLCMLIAELGIKYLQTGSGFRVNDTVTSLGAGVTSQTTKFVLRGVDVFVYVWIFENWRLWTLPLRSWWAWILAFLAADLAYYWLHRANHEVSILWASHQTHHSSEEYNLSTALRQSMFSTIYGWIIYLPMAFFGFTPVAHVVHVQLNTLFQFWVHTTVIKNLGPLELILNTPSHHRVHHGRNRYCIDKNYAGALIIWDRMFGTFEAEKPEEEVVYGIITPINSFNGIWVQTNYYISSIARLGDYSSFRHKIMSLIMGPGWGPGTARLGNPETLPLIEYPVRVYDVQTSLGRKVYVVLHFVAVLAFFDHTAKEYETWDTFDVWIASTCILVSLGNLGSVMDKRWWANYAEAARCAVMFLLLPDNFDLPDTAVVLAQILFGMSLSMWIINLLRTMFPTQQTFAEHTKEKSN